VFWKNKIKIYIFAKIYFSTTMIINAQQFTINYYKKNQNTNIVKKLFVSKVKIS